MGRRRLYKSAEEAKAAQKAQQAAFWAARKNGTWVRKNQKHGTAIDAKTRARLAKKKTRERRKAARLAAQEANATRHAELLAEYGFEVWRNKPVDPHSAEELAARKRYAQAEEAAYRARHRAHITEYNREYRRRKRAAELVAAQKTWTAAEWAAYQRRTALRESGPGTPAWLVREVVKRLAAQENLSEEIVTQQLIERGGLDFIVQGALALGPEKARRPAFIAAAFRATCLYLNPDRAVLCGVGAGGSGIRDQGSEKKG